MDYIANGNLALTFELSHFITLINVLQSFKIKYYAFLNNDEEILYLAVNIASVYPCYLLIDAYYIA